MNDLLKFIKDWIPSIGVIVAGGWLFFKWLYEEKLRRQKEMPAIDGKLSAKVISFGKNKKLVTIEGTWNNHSPLPLYLDINQCTIDIFKIDEDINLPNCNLILKSDLGEPVCSYKFLLKMVEVDYFLEPNTESTIVNHFILEKGIYGVRMVLHTSKKGGLWWKETILDIQQHE